MHQQGVVELRRLIRQRSRWFQGHLQSWRLIPLVLRSARRARTDLLYHLTSPAVLLIASLLSASFLFLAKARYSRGRARTRRLVGRLDVRADLRPRAGLQLRLLAPGAHERRGARRTVVLAHLYVCYGLMWYAAGWWAVGRTLRGRTGWAKTDRVPSRRRRPAPIRGRAAGPDAAGLPVAASALARRPAGVAPPGRANTRPPLPGALMAVPQPSARPRSARRCSRRRAARPAAGPGAPSSPGTPGLRHQLGTVDPVSRPGPPPPAAPTRRW